MFNNNINQIIKNNNKPMWTITKKRGHPEDDLQMEGVSYLRLAYPKLRFSISPINKLKKKTIYSKGRYIQYCPEGVRNYRMGYNKGTHDITIYKACKGYHGLCVEFKVGSNKQTPEQKEWQEDLIKENYFYELVYTFDKFKEIVDWYLR